MKNQKTKFQKLNIIILIVATIFAILIVLFGTWLKGKCFCDSQCAWKIVNCCPENAGARWECVNLRTFIEPKCDSLIFCPQVISPKPEAKCICENWSCVAK